MKFSLLIQGPILSIGKTNKNIKVNETNTNIVNFYTEEYIFENVSKYGYLFEKIIISTWSNEDITRLKELMNPFKNVNIVQFEDVYKGIYQKKFKNSNHEINVNNKLKMFNGINNSLKNFSSNEIIIRIRTDQLLALDLLIDEIKKFGNTYKFFLPYLTGTGYFQDFYFAANKKIMQKFLNFYCENYKEIEMSPHYEFFYRIFICMNFKNKYLLATSSISQKIISKILEKRYFRALPSIVYKKLEWRGNPINVNYNRELFFSDQMNGYYNKIKFNRKIRENILFTAYLTPTKQLFNFKNNIGNIKSIFLMILLVTKITKINHFILKRL